jgi:hypothetical protein
MLPLCDNLEYDIELATAEVKVLYKMSLRHLCGPFEPGQESQCMKN